jgi:hypothetical protein
MTDHPISIKLIAVILVALHVTKSVLTGKYIAGEKMVREVGREEEKRGKLGRIL